MGFAESPATGGTSVPPAWYLQRSFIEHTERLHFSKGKHHVLSAYHFLQSFHGLELAPSHVFVMHIHG